MIPEHVLRVLLAPVPDKEKFDKPFSSVSCKGIKPRLPRHNLTTEFVDKIYVDDEEKVVVVKFCTGDTEVVKCGEHDEFDINVGVALGICRYLFGNHTRFYKHVVERKTIHNQKRKATKKSDYDLYRDWCAKNHKRFASEVTFVKNKAKYLAKMKGEK